MADYNIYIHSINGGGIENQTVPWGEKSSSGVSSEDSNVQSWFGKTAQALGFGMNPDSLISKGIDVAAKAVPAIAVAKIAIAVTNAMYQTAQAFTGIMATQTGDYDFNNRFEQFQNVRNAITHPFSTAISMWQANIQMHNDALRNEQNRLLLGDSAFNQVAGRGRGI